MARPRGEDIALPFVSGGPLCCLKLRECGELPCSPASLYRMSSLQTPSGCLSFLGAGAYHTAPESAERK